jgi:integrase
LNPAPKTSLQQKTNIIIKETDETLNEFTNFLNSRKNLSHSVVIKHRNNIRRFLIKYDGVVSPETIETHAINIKNRWKVQTYANHLCSLKRFVRDFLKKDWMSEYEFPNIERKPIIVPQREHLIDFFNAIPLCSKDNSQKIEPRQKYQALFLLLASSGLRISEALSLKRGDIYPDKRMVIPRDAHETSSTKRSWMSFYNEECEKYLLWIDDLKQEELLFPTKDCVYSAFRKAYDETDIKITPQNLRNWFCSEMGRLGVPDRYVDAFCGRTPKSVLARHYTDYSPRKLKEIYDKANLKVLK